MTGVRTPKIIHKLFVFF
jgi:E3 ubiquitin-protein ligase RNF5